LVADLMVLPAVRSAQRDHKFVTGLATDRSGLSKAKVMRIRRAAATQQARLQCHKAQVGFISMAANFTERPARSCRS